MTAEEPIIEAQGLVKRYGAGSGAVRALDGIDLRVMPGEVFGFLGPNGAGKTTSIRILTGQLAPTSGRVRVAGCDVVKDRKALHGSIGVVFDVANLYDQLSGRRNLFLFADLYGCGRSEVDALLQRVDLVDAADRAFRTYSKGMKQRLALARALLPGPRVLFLDEPTSALDPASARRVREIVNEVSESGTTVFLTTHLMELADQVCDRVAILHGGRIIAVDTPRRLKRMHRAPRLRIRVGEGEEAREELLEMEGPATGERLAALVSAGGVTRVDTEEPTLEEVFLSLTGSELQ